MTAWWSNERIRATVNQEYVERELGSKKHVDRLHRVLAFGDGLTDDTYFDWIIERSPRFFLALNQIGVPERIFEVIDKSFDDEDLPLSQDALWELNLFGGKSETLDKKFYREQFNFLIQELEPGGHVDYGAWDVIPVEPMSRRPSIAPSQSNDKVYAHDHLYTRKKIPTFGENGIDQLHFVMHLKALIAIQHPHLVSVWATYSQDDFNYVLLTPSIDTTLKTYLEDPPKAFKVLDKQERREILLTWTHCLTSALAYLHDADFTHEAIRPSTIIVDQKNTIYLADFKALKVLDTDETSTSYSGELYDYAAPENWLRKPTLHETAALKSYLPGGGRTSRRIPKSPPVQPKASPPLCTTAKSSEHTNSKSSSSPSAPTVPKPRNALITTFAPPQLSSSSASSGSSHTSKTKATDVFSLTAILLTLLSSLLGHTPKSFASHRSRLNRQAGRGNAPPDASFHKNLPQVVKWIDMLAKEAGQKEKKDVKLWGSVVELVQVCRSGVSKDHRERIGARDLDQKVGGWLEWGLGKRRKCACVVAKEGAVVLEGESADTGEMNGSEYLKMLRYEGLKQSRGDFCLSQDGSHKQMAFPSSLPSLDMLDFQPEPLNVAAIRPASLLSGNASTVWGLKDVRDDGNASVVWGLRDVRDSDTEDRAATPKPTVEREDTVSAMSSYIASGVSSIEENYGDSETTSGAESEVRTEDWPLPLGTLTFEHGARS
ncbi:hypothetical protein MMC28_007053 [Mycoblastus sanguinarius]|nr:hypothetical protein [Mycoblastus sanguinarius]